MKQGFPKANRTVQDFSRRWPGALMTPNVLLFHSTEGMSWPDYEGGSKAPTYTARPLIKRCRLAWRQHFDETESARALRNEDGGVETNTLNVVQVELIGTTDPFTRDKWIREGYTQDEDFIYWPEAPDWAIAAIAEFIADLHRRLGIPLNVASPDPWPGYPASITAARMSPAQWRGFRGICAHMHAPENQHGDVKFAVRRAVAMAKDLIDGGKKTKWAKARAALLDLIDATRQVEADIDSVSPVRKRIHALGDDLGQIADDLLAEVKDLPKE